MDQGDYCDVFTLSRAEFGKVGDWAPVIGGTAPFFRCFRLLGSNQIFTQGASFVFLVLIFRFFCPVSVLSFCRTQLFQQRLFVSCLSIVS